MSRTGEKLIPLFAELVKSIGCEVIFEEPESDLLIFNDTHGRNLEIDVHPINGLCYVVLTVLERPFIEYDENEIISDRLLCQGEIHDPNCLSKIKESIQFNDKPGTNN